jgi:Cu/Zn superoxide dismutase
VYQTRRLAAIVIGLTLLESLALGDSALAQEAKSVQLTPSRDSGVSGTASLTDVEGGVRVQLNMRGLPEAGVKHINHIHGGGTCADDRAGRTAPVTIPLNPVVAKEDGTGSATTTIEGVTLAGLFAKDKDRFILLHAKTEKGQGVPAGISCADLDLASADATNGTGGTTLMRGETTMGGRPLPGSGGSAILLPAAALLLGSGVLVYAILRRTEKLRG